MYLLSFGTYALSRASLNLDNREAMRGFDLVIFDCDGVVVDSEVLSCRCLAEVLARHGVTIGLEEVFARFLGRSFDAVERYFREESGRDLPEGFRDELFARLRTAYRRSLKPMPQIFDAIGRIDRPYCLASSSDMSRIRLALSVTGLDEAFGDRVFNAAMVPRSKPAPDLFLFAAGAMAAEPRRSLVVEDTIAGVEAGKAAGMTVWGFTGGSHCVGRDVAGALTEAGADRVVTSMAELAGG